jgi:hypothetical protein
MATPKRTIGKLPVYRGTYTENQVYSKFNIVTYLGSTFICTVDANENVPCTIENNSFVLSYGWSFMADNSYSYLMEQKQEFITQNEFDQLEEMGLLDPTKDYYTYEEE